MTLRDADVRNFRLTSFVLLIAVTATATARAGETDAAGEPVRVVDVQVRPTSIDLKTRQDSARFVVQAVRSDGTTYDATAEAELEAGEEGIVRIDGQTVTPLQDGETMLRVSHGGREIVVPVKVEKSQQERAVSFRADVLPVLTKSGCNRGACHGGTRGKDGFRLSMLGYDAAADYHRLTHELPGRRINVSSPEKSLLLMKASGGVPHSGGTAIPVGSPSYKTLVRWLEAGAPNDPLKLVETMTIPVAATAEPELLVIEPMSPWKAKRYWVKARALPLGAGATVLGLLGAAVTWRGFTRRRVGALRRSAAWLFACVTTIGGVGIVYGMLHPPKAADQKKVEPAALVAEAPKPEPQTIQQWRPEPDVLPVSLEIYPGGAVLPASGETQQFIVRAVYSDGTDRDVTELARFKSSDESAVAVSEEGLVTSGARGEAFVTAAFDSLVTGAQVLSVPAEGGIAASKVEPANYVDKHIGEKLRKLKITPSAPCSDEEFLRRLYLDLAGRLPTPEEREKYLAATEPGRREATVETLLASEEFVDLWTMRWAELLQMRSSPPLTVSQKGTHLYHAWIREQVARNTPIDEVVRALITAEGAGFENPAAHFYLYETDTLMTAENVAQAFLGLRLKCAHCHNHPFDRWTTDDYFGFAAFFSRIGRKRALDPRDKAVLTLTSGELEDPVRKAAAPPRFLGGGTPDLADQSRREALAEWITASENPYFARNWANIVWAHLFGQGIVDPVDDVRLSNPPSNPELLDALAARLVEYQFDARRLMRDICLSEAYARSTVANDENREDERNFARRPLRRLRAEVLLDCISQVTESSERYPMLGEDGRAVQIVDGMTTNYFLTAFGRATRRSVCACEVQTEATLSQALHMVNGDTVHEKIVDGGVIARELEAGRDPAAILDALYIRCLCRPPTEAERTDLLAFVEGADDKRTALQDVFWGLLNSHEFVFTH